MNQKLLLFSCVALLFPANSCSRRGGGAMLSATGKPYEVLVMMNEAQWERPAGRALYDALRMNVEGLPQSEPSFDVTAVAPPHFDTMFKMVRNIIIVDISDIYTAPKISVERNVWATNQVVLKIQAPDEESFQHYVDFYADRIVRFLNDVELQRGANALKKTYNATAANKIMDMFGVELHFLNDLNVYKEGENFFWASNDKGAGRIDIVVYSFSYTDVNTFTTDYLVAKRDSVMKINIQGAFEGSYMTTEKRIDPTYRAITVNNAYCGELRGLWRMEKDMMGGPFVSHARLDATTQHIVVVETFVFAPERKKRNLIKVMEAALYTLKLPGEQENTENTIELSAEEEGR